MLEVVIEITVCLSYTHAIRQWHGTHTLHTEWLENIWRHRIFNTYFSFSLSLMSHASRIGHFTTCYVCHFIIIEQCLYLSLNGYSDCHFHFPFVITMTHFITYIFPLKNVWVSSTETLDGLAFISENISSLSLNFHSFQNITAWFVSLSHFSFPFFSQPEYFITFPSIYRHYMRAGSGCCASERYAAAAAAAAARRAALAARCCQRQR